MKLHRLIALFAFLTLLGNSAFFINQALAAEQPGTIKGQVFDSLGAVVSGADVLAIDIAAQEKSTTTNQKGEFVLEGLKAGVYTLRVSAPKFGLYEKTAVEVRAGKEESLAIGLAIESIKEEVIVSENGPFSADSPFSVTVLSEKDLEALPDDPEQFKAALRAIAGPGVDFDDEDEEDGGITVDGFSGGKIPSKRSIREVRINRSNYSAEYDRAGSGGIEILTRPGAGNFNASAFFNFNDYRLNSRSPFAANRTPSQTKNYGGSFSGPLQKGKSSFFLDVGRNQSDVSRVVNASVLDSSFNTVPFNQDVSVPTSGFNISARIDYQINKNHNLMGRYNFAINRSENQGVSELSLPSRAFQSSNSSQDIRLAESFIINSKIVNETRFGYNINRREQDGDNSIPTINVSGAFMGGGSQIGLNFAEIRRWELQNYTTASLGKNNEHSVKFGIRIKSVSIEDRSESNFGGIFTFAGVRDPLTGALLYSSIEQYRQKVLGNSDPRFNPSQFSITSGDPLTGISQREIALFVNEDWRVRQNLTLSFGLRYENQTNISDYTDFAPRFGFAWAPGAAGKQSKTVIRGGAGIFYSRLGENFFLQAERFNGVRQTQYVVASNPTILGQAVFSLNDVSNAPTIDQLSAFARAGSLTIRRLSDDLESPTIYQGSLSIDRKLPKQTSVSLSYLVSRNLHSLSTRNVNAPVCETILVCSSNALRPDQTRGNIYQYESAGVMNQQQLLVNFNTGMFKTVTLGGSYRLSFANSNSDGMGSFPAYSYDSSSEYGSSSQDVRHNLTVYSSVRLPWDIRVSPMFTMSSGRPYNITTGIDSNYDSIFNDRPTYAQLKNVCSERALTGSFCELGAIDNPETTLIPRNFGRGSRFSMVNLSVNQTFSFKDGSDNNYSFTVGIQINNLFNLTNQGTPIGNLSSDRFGQSYYGAGGFGFSGGANRRIDLQGRFTF